MFSNNQPLSSNNELIKQLDLFVKAHQQELAALAWGLWLENGDTKGTIGIDLQPTPHFVYCPQAAVEKLNHNVGNRLGEILGLIKHHQPEKEVLMISIAPGQVKLIYFEPQTSPPACFELLGEHTSDLLDRLEQQMSQDLPVA